jgi:hypothetical protein
MTLTVTQLAVLIVVAIVALELIKLATQYFFGRLTKDNYVTTEELQQKCSGCHENNSRERRTNGTQLEVICRDMKEMKQILLIVALKNDISPEELKTLVG